MNDRAGQLLVAAGVLALGAAFAIAAWMLPEAAGYARVSVRLFPGFIAAGLVVAGLMLAREAARGGFRNIPEEEREHLDWRAFAWVSGGVIAHMALIAGIGFVLASALLYAATARAFRSRRPVRDLGVGFVLAVAVFLLFTQALTLGLPWGAWIPGGIP